MPIGRSISRLATSVARLPLWGHVCVVTAVVLGSAWWVGAAGTMSVDEGVSVLQAQALQRGAWSIDYPLASADPEGSAFPLRAAEPAEQGWVPYGKHPLYPVLLSVAGRVGGVNGMVALSIVGSVGAAVAAAAIARRLGDRLATPCLYAVGLGSPLFFDSALIIAHSVGAAAVGVASITLMRHHEESSGWVSRWLLVAGPALVVVPLLRSEGLLMLAALALVSCVIALAHRRPAWVSTASLAVVSVLLARAIERGWRRSIFGVVPALPGRRGSGSGDGSVIYDRVQGFLTVMVKPSYGGGRHDLLLLLAVSALLVAVVALRRGGADERAAVTMAIVGAGFAVAWATTAPASPVPGILLAFPALWVGLGMGPWASSALARVLLSVAGVFCIGVLATQYPQGGGLEWGARYLAIALPLVVPVALVGLARGWGRIGNRRFGAVAGGSLLVLSLALGSMSVESQRQTNAAVRRFEARLSEVAGSSTFGETDRDQRGVIVSADFIVPQVTWTIYDDYRWLRLRDDEPIVVDGPDARLRALIDTGVSRFTFITPNLERDLPLLGRGVTVGPDQGIDGWSIVEVVPQSA